MAKPKLLVVDDQLINIRLLQRKLEQNGMEVSTATSGERAIELIDENVPDLVLLDIMMPGMDGIEVCRRLKSEDRTKDIPIIFVTARTSKEGKIEGLGVGAADYLVKPIDLDETLARIHTQLRIIENHRENLRLSQELEERKRQSAIMHLTEGIAHNLNNLIGVASGYLSLLRATKNAPDKMEKSFSKLDSAFKRMSQIVHELTVIGQFDSIHTQYFSLASIIEITLERFKRDHHCDREIKVVRSFPPEFDLVTNGELLIGAIERLLANAWESYDESTPIDEKIIELRMKLQNKETPQEQLVIEIVDEGRGIPDDIRDNVFDPFVSTFSAVGKGMGLTIVQHSIRSLKGSIQLIDNKPKGVIACVCLPTNMEITINSLES